MKSKFLLLIFLYSLESLFAQEFAVVLDKDGYTNVRIENNKNSKILDKLYNEDLVCVMNPEGNWWKIDYALKKNEMKVGYVYKNRIKLISEYNEVPISEVKDKEIIFSNKTIEVKVVENKFDKNKHSFNYVKNYPNQILKIDGKDYWGTDGEMPKTEYKSITIIFNDTKLQLPKEALENLFEPNLSLTKVNFDKDKDIIYISAMNSDGAGGYLVIWKIEKGIYKERFVAYGF